MTGLREAMVATMDTSQYPDAKALEGISWPEAAESEEPVEINTIEEMLERRQSAPLFYFPSDHEQFDSMFAEHPLSQIRARLEEVSSSLKIDKTWWQSIKPFRVRH